MSWGVIFFSLIGIVGIAFLITGQSMKTSGKIKVGWFIGQDIKMEKCRDIPGFINATYTKIMSAGVIAVVGAAVLILLEVFKISPLIQLIILILLLVLYFVFSRDIQKATKEYLQ